MALTIYRFLSPQSPTVFTPLWLEPHALRGVKTVEDCYPSCVLPVRWSWLDGSDPWISIFPEGVGFQPNGDIEIQGLRDKRPELK